MSRPGTGYIAGAAFALYAVAGAAAYAQPAPADHPRMERQERTVIIHHGGEGHEHMAMMRHGGENPAEHLRTMLQLKAGQEAALTAYLAAIHPAQDHKPMVEMAGHDGAKTTPQRLAEMETRMTEHTAAMHARIEATKRFYDQLEPSQKKVFDELPMMMGAMGPMGPNMMMMHGPPGPHMAPMPPMPPKAPVPPKP